MLISLSFVLSFQDSGDAGNTSQLQCVLLSHLSGQYQVSKFYITKLFTTRGWYNIEMASYHYREAHYKDEAVVRPSHLHNGNSYTGKMASSYWSSPLNKMAAMFYHGCSAI